MESRGAACIMSEFFTAKAPQWDASSRRQVLAQRIVKSIVDRIALQADMEIIDLGAGTGLLTYNILPYVDTITALDTSEAMLRELERKMDSEGRVIARLQDISQEKLPDAAYDGVVSSMTLHHIEHLKPLFEHLYAALRKGGFVAIADLVREDGSFHGGDCNGVHHFGFEASALRERVRSAGFTDVAFEIIDVIHKAKQEYPIFLLTAFK